jgi:hypothetical protein
MPASAVPPVAASAAAATQKRPTRCRCPSERPRERPTRRIRGRERFMQRTPVDAVMARQEMHRKAGAVGGGFVHSGEPGARASRPR